MRWNFSVKCICFVCGVPAKSYQDFSKKLTVSFIGAKDGADQACGADYTAEAVESELAVVIIIEAHPSKIELGPNVGCTRGGFLRTAVVKLQDVLGDRAVLEIKQGLPVAVTAP